MTSITYALPGVTRDVSLRGALGGGPTLAGKGRLKDAAALLASIGAATVPSGMDGPDEKGLAGDEMPSSYIPLSLARSKLLLLSTELASMKARHMSLIDAITEKYERMTEESRTQFEGVVDEVKARASLKLKENKAQLEAMREELLAVQEAQAAKNTQYRNELKAATAEQGRLQQELLARSAETAEMKAQHDASSSVIQQRVDEIAVLQQSSVPRADLDALAAEKNALQAQLEANSAELARAQLDAETARARVQEMEAELTQAKESADAALAAAQANQASATSSEGAREAADRLAEKEALVANLEAQLASMQAGGGSDSGSGPARIVNVADPEILSTVRKLESEMNKLLRENTDLALLITQREEMVAQSNLALEVAKKMGRDSATAGGAGSSAAAAAVPAGEDEYDEVQEEEEFTELVPDPSSASAANPRAQALSASLSESQGKLDALTASISDLEKIIKPKVADYKARLGAFKTDSERTELLGALGLAQGVGDDEGEGVHDVGPRDLAAMEDMLAATDSQASTKATLAARVGVLKASKATLESNKALLADKKTLIMSLKASGDEAKAAQEEKGFMDLRGQMQADAGELKASYAEYEEQVKAFKVAEGNLQATYVKFKVDPQAEEGKRKLTAEHRASIERLLGLAKGKAKEKEALRALADEVTKQNASLKEVRTQRDAAMGEVAAKTTELQALAPSTEGASTTGGGMKSVTSKRTVTRRVPRARAAAASSSSSASGAPLVPHSLLTNLKPIDLKSRAGMYAGREFHPLTPYVPKVPVGSVSASASGGSYAAAASAASHSSAAGGQGNDPALQRKFDALKARESALESELATLRASADTQAETLASRESELDALRAQLRTLTEGDVDERVAALSAQLATQRSEVAAHDGKHKLKLAELKSLASEAQREVKDKAEEVERLHAEVKHLQDKLKHATRRASVAAVVPVVVPVAAAAAADSGAGAAADHALLAQHASQLSALQSQLNSVQGLHGELQGEHDSLRGKHDALQRDHDSRGSELASLQSRLGELESEVATHAGSLAHQLAAKEAHLVALHAEQVALLETQISDTMEKLKITKKKAKELHDALQAETAVRQGLESNVADLSTKVAGMEVVCAAAASTEKRLTADIASRDGVIEQKTSEIDGLLTRQQQLEKDVSFLELRNVEEIRRRKEFQFKYEEAKGKVRVYARVRPFSKQEIEQKEGTLLRPGTNEWTIMINEKQKNYQGVVTDSWRPIEFDHIFQCGLDNTKRNDSQMEIFEETKIFAELTVQGINCCVFAYGQSGTGKTFTMAGKKPSEENGHTTELLGLKPRMIERVYQMKHELQKTHTIDISCYMLEIYLNKLEDVFWKLDTRRKYAGKEKSKWPEPPELKVRVDAKKKVVIDNGDAKGIMKKFDTKDEMQTFCDEAETTRRVRKTGLNEESSRSHLIFAIIVESTDKKTGKKTTGKLSLVDLAGSERAEKTNVEGLTAKAREAMMEEGISINESLRMLKSVFRILGEANKPLEKGKKAEIVQYRGNMLTELMQDSLGGGAKTLMFVNVGPAASNISESVDSLAYGDLVKNITNEKVTADADNEEQIRFLGVQLRAYEAKFGPLDG